MSEKLFFLVLIMLWQGTVAFGNLDEPWPIPAWQSCASPSDVGISEVELNEYKQWLTSRAEGRPFGTIIIRHGRITCEYYGSGAERDSCWEIGSLRKAVASTLLGMAIREGKIDTNQVVSDIWPDVFQQTGQDKDKQIKVSHFFNSTSGWKRAEMPGTKWVYSNSAFTAGGMVLGRVYGMPEDRIASLAHKRVAKSLGASSWHCYHYERDFSKSFSNPGPKLAIDSNLRDLARFGYLWLRQGQWGSEQLIPRAFVTQATQNQVAHLGAHYGYCWFVNDGQVLLPNAPADTYYHVGNGKDNRRTVLAIVPSLDLVAVVGTHAAQYDITKQYKAQPVPHVNEWLSKIVTCIKVPSPTSKIPRYYFPPRGNNRKNHQERNPVDVGLNPTVISKLRSFIREHPYVRNNRIQEARWALWRNGYLLHVEGDFYKKQDVASLRKTWHAMIVGAALKQGKIPSLQEKLSTRLETLHGQDADASWWHVITQSAGFDYPYDDWPDFAPGDMWTYSDWNLVHLCDALAKVYGKQDFHDCYQDVAAQAYFDAIGMEGWSTCIKKDGGFSAPSDGVRFVLNLEHMGRLGLIALARGSWAGKQIVPRWFVEELESKQTYGMRVNYEGPNDGRIGLSLEEFPECPYGYLTWTNTDQDLYPGASRHWANGRGAGGTIILWNHQSGIVFAGVGIDLGSTPQNIPLLIEQNIRTANPELPESRKEE